MTHTHVLDTQRLSTLAHAYEREIVQFLRELVAIPAPSCQEGRVIQRIRQEMEKVGFDEIRIDGMGNILGRIGSGKTVIMMDAHSDTAGLGDLRDWGWDPYKGKLDDSYVYGRGACDPHAGMVSMVYAGKLIHELGMHGDFTLWVTGTVQKEDCNGLPWLYILKEDGIRPDCVLLTEPTNLRIHRGQRGRAEIEIHLGRTACGDQNPIYKMTRLVQEVEHLNQRLRRDSAWGKATIAVTEIHSRSMSRSDVRVACSVHLERRLTAGESRESVLDEVRALPGTEGAEIEIPSYDKPSYTGLRYPMAKYYPTWALGESHPVVQAAIATYEALFELPPVIGKWSSSTNGAGSMGLMGVPTIGFGPGEEDVSHGVGERVPIRHLVKAAQFYATFPTIFVDTLTRR